MSILTKPINPLSANIEYEFELSVAELLVLVQSVTTSDYWEDTNNWRAVDFVYVNSQKQYQRIVFDLSTNELQVDFAFNQNSINGVFQCGRITVFGYVNDSLRIKRSFYDDEFDIVIVDGIDLGTTIVITSVTPPAFGTYSEGEVLTFTLNFSDLVNITGLSLLNEDGTLVLLEDEYALLLEDTQLVLLVGSEIRYATYVSGSESANVVYEYVVQAGDQDLDGIEILSLDLNGGVIIGVNGESVNITIPTTDTSGVLIDNSAPDIIAPTITDILVSDGIYEDQDDIIFTVEFSENVLVSGSPVLTLDIGGVTRQAALLSSSLNQAVFSYTVEQPDNDNNGIEILSLDNGVITDAALNPLDRTLPVVDTSNVFVSTDIIAPTILSITAVDGNYKAGDNLNFTATFSEPVVITGTPYLLVDIGGTQVQANMTSNNSADATFSYTVLAGQLDLNGVQVLSLDSAVITDNALNLLDRTLPSMDMSLVKVDAVAPSINSINVPNGVYTETNPNIVFTLQFSENIIISGAPVLELDIGGVTKFASLTSNTSTQAVFTYTISIPDNDNNGIQIVSLNDGVITDNFLNPLNRTLPIINTSNVKVFTDINPPTITSIDSINKTYKTGDNLSFTVNFSKNVIITGTPYLLVDIGGTQVQANLAFAGTFQSIFSYTILAGQLDTNGVQVLSLDGGTITDSILQPLNRTLPIINTTLVLVDGVSPSITSISAPADDNYTTGQVISFVANFTENVVVTGTPFLQVQIGSSAKQFDYVLGGSGTNALTFSYTVLAGDLDEDGILFSSTDIQIPSATIKDAAGNNAVLSFTAPATTGITVNQPYLQIVEDSSFYSNFTATGTSGTGSSVHDTESGITSINEIIIQNSSLYISGNFTRLNGGVVYNLIKTDLAGTPDATYNSNAQGVLLFESISTGIVDFDVNNTGNVYTPASTSNLVTKLNSNGTKDISYVLSGYSYSSFSSRTVSIQSDGSIIVGGMFITNTGREHALVKTDNLGVIDTVFAANTERYFNGSSYVGGFHNTAGSTFVRKIIKDVDSKIIVVGNFNQFNDTTRNGFLRLNQDGTEDTGFYNSISTVLNANFASLNLVDNIVIGEGGKLYLEGTFYDGITTFKIIRLTSSLGLDNTFNAIPVISGAAKLLNILPDNTLLVQPSTPSTSTFLKLYNNQGIEVSTVATPSLAAGSGVNINTIALDEINKTIYIGGRFDLIQVGSSSNLVRRFITKVI